MIMIDPYMLGKLAAELRKYAIAYRKGRSGRNVKSKDISKQLNAAGATHMPKGVIGYPKGTQT